MSDFLDKVALRVSKWGCCPMPGVWVYSDSTPDVIARSLDRSETVNKQQWLQRRKELINEPEITLAPKWANWIMQTGTGDWFWSPVEPVLCQEGAYWFLGMGEVMYEHAATGMLPAGHDWRKTPRRISVLRGAPQGDGLPQEEYGMNEVKTINRQMVETLALDAGFELKEGSELRPYVYAFAWALEKAVLNNARKQRNAETVRHLGLIDSVIGVIEEKIQESAEEAENALAEGSLDLSNALKAQAWTLSVIANQVRGIESRAQRQFACEAMRFHDWYIKFDPRDNPYHRNTAQSAWNEALGAPQMTKSHVRLTPMESASCSIEWHKREFEVWANSKDLDISVHTLNDNGGIVYDSDFTDLAWQSWLASKGVKS